MKDTDHDRTAIEQEAIGRKPQPKAADNDDGGQRGSPAN